MRLILVWLFDALALLMVTYLVPGVSVQDPMHALVAALVLGLVNMMVKPALVILTLPITVLTLGLFLLVINGMLFWAVGSVLKGFTVAGFGSGLLGAIAYSVLTWLFSRLIPERTP